MSKGKSSKAKKIVESTAKITFDQFFDRAVFLKDIPEYEKQDVFEFFKNKDIDFKSDLETFEQALRTYKES